MRSYIQRAGLHPSSSRVALRRQLAQELAAPVTKVEHRPYDTGWQMTLPNQHIPASFADEPADGITRALNTSEFPDKPVANSVSVDWLEFTLPFTGLADWVQIADGVLQLDHRYFVAGKGIPRYPEARCFGSITICFGARVDMGVHVILGGRALREWASLTDGDVRALVRRILLAQGKFSRVDLAIDDVEEKLSLDRIRFHMRPAFGFKVRDSTGVLVTPTRVRTKCRTMLAYSPVHTRLGIKMGDGIYFGSRSSGVYFRFYDKAIEQGIDGHWVRAEVQLRHEHSHEAACQLVGSEVATVATGVFRHYLSFLRASRDTNFARWPVAAWWDQFLGGSDRLPLSVLRPVRTLNEHVQWFSKNMATSVALLWAHCGGVFDTLYGRIIGLVDDGWERLGQRHRSMLALDEAWQLAAESFVWRPPVQAPIAILS